MTAGLKTLEILDRPGSYEHLDKITGKLIDGILQAGRDAGHAVSGGHISGMYFSRACAYILNKSTHFNNTATHIDSENCVITVHSHANVTEI